MKYSSIKNHNLPDLFIRKKIQSIHPSSPLDECLFPPLLTTIKLKRDILQEHPIPIVKWPTKLPIPQANKTQPLLISHTHTHGTKPFHFLNEGPTNTYIPYMNMTMAWNTIKPTTNMTLASICDLMIVKIEVYTWHWKHYPKIYSFCITSINYSLFIQQYLGRMYYLLTAEKTRNKEDSVSVSLKFYFRNIDRQ